MLFVCQIIGLLLDERMEQFTDPPCHARIIFGFGLTSMRERVEQLHGTMEIMSRPEWGTTIVIQIPLRHGDIVNPPAS